MYDKQLNYKFNQMKLNSKKNVGSLMEEIRKCDPSTVEEWKEYYYNNVRTVRKINNLAKKLADETIESLDICREYINICIIQRTFDGYMREMKMIDKINEAIGEKVVHNDFPPEWDSQYRIDAILETENGRIGIQFKPASYLTQYYDNSRQYDKRAWTQAQMDRIVIEVILIVDRNAEMEDGIKQIKEYLALDKCREM